jgi:hypothetical protein
VSVNQSIKKIKIAVHNTVDKSHVFGRIVDDRMVGNISDAEYFCMYGLFQHRNFINRLSFNRDVNFLGYVSGEHGGSEEDVPPGSDANKKARAKYWATNGHAILTQIQRRAVNDDNPNYQTVRDMIADNFKDDLLDWNDLAPRKLEIVRYGGLAPSLVVWMLICCMDYDYFQTTFLNLGDDAQTNILFNCVCCLYEPHISKLQCQPMLILKILNRWALEMISAIIARGQGIVANTPYLLGNDSLVFLPSPTVRLPSSQQFIYIS